MGFSGRSCVAVAVKYVFPFGDDGLKSNDFATVETIHDLCKFSTGYDLLVVFLLVSGHSQTEVADLLGVSRQAVSDQMLILWERYKAGRWITAREAKARRRIHHDQ